MGFEPTTFCLPSRERNGGIGTPGLLEIYIHGFLMAQVNNPLVQFLRLSNLYFNFMFFARRNLNSWDF